MPEVEKLSEREEYLDELLKGMDGNSNQPERHTREEGFVDSFDKELEGINEEEFLREFEKSLGDDLDADLETEFSKSNESNSDLEEELGLNADSTSADFMDDINHIVNNVKNGTLDDGLGGLGDGDLSIEESLKNFEEEDPDLDAIGREFATEESYVNTFDTDLDAAGEAGEATGATEELSEAEKLAKEIESLNLEVEETKSGAKKEEKDPAIDEAKNQEEEEKKGTKKGFFARLSAILFGEEEEETVPKQGTVAAPMDIENLSDENLSALMELENQNASAAEEEKKKQEEEEKKALKEQKEKEKAEKKAEKKALKEQKAREKAEKKALKKKNQEPVEKTKPLPKKPVVLIMLLGLSVVILVNLLSGVIGYSTALSDAEDYYAQGKYVEAYGCLNEKDMKEADLEFYNKVRLTSYLQQQLNSYDAYQSQSMYKEALSALICGVGRYDRFIEDATEAGVDREYTKMMQKIEEALSGSYQMSLDEARAVYALDDKKEFTYAVYDVIGALGLEEEP